MAILSHFITFPSLFPHRHNWQHQLQQSHKLCNFCAFSIKKSRKVKTNAELCDDIRDFVAVNGLPEGYVPTVKEFSQLGRSDLAYIVRRRGYRVIGELLGSTKETDLLDGFNMEKGTIEDQVRLSTSENKYEKPIDFVGVQAIRNCSNSFLLKTDDNDMAVEAFGELENDLISLDIGENEGGPIATALPDTENHVNSSVVGQTIYSGIRSQEILGETTSGGDIASSYNDPRETMEGSINMSVGEEMTQNGWHEDKNTAEQFALTSDVFVTETIPCSANVDQALVLNEESTVLVSLKEKVANFMQHQHLATAEESDSCVTLKESGVDEVESMNFNGNIAPKSMQVVTATTGNYPIRDENLVVERQSTLLSNGAGDKTGKRDNNVESMKESELSRLKEQIVKEKRALSLLQAKAETEMSRAQKLISVKDAELLVAEEMLSELVEVQIRYHGEGEIVELAGSFNGWHHWIKMDPNPSSSITDPIESRKSKLWTTVLWLYPGIYEIKFVVDGEWKIDPHMESVSNSAICNNILRVHR